jgi:hypothetical protein
MSYPYWPKTYWPKTYWPKEYWPGGMGEAGYLLAIQDASHAHTADSLGLTQTHLLSVQDAAHAHSADSPTLTQTHNLAVADALHAHTANNITFFASAPEIYGELQVSILARLLSATPSCR